MVKTTILTWLHLQVVHSVRISSHFDYSFTTLIMYDQAKNAPKTTKSQNRPFSYICPARTRIFTDMRFSPGGRYRWGLLNRKIWSKSLEPFLRKWPKTTILTTFLCFMDEPKFFCTNRRARFFLLSCRIFVQKIKKILRAVFEKNWRLTN